MPVKFSACSLPEVEALPIVASRKLADICRTYGYAQVTTEKALNPGWVTVMVEAETERQAGIVKGYILALAAL